MRVDGRQPTEEKRSLCNKQRAMSALHAAENSSCNGGSSGAKVEAR